jgi:hypothetical protein
MMDENSMMDENNNVAKRALCYRLLSTRQKRTPNDLRQNNRKSKTGTTEIILSPQVAHTKNNWKATCPKQSSQDNVDITTDASKNQKPEGENRKNVRRTIPPILGTRKGVTLVGPDLNQSPI